MSPSAIDIRDVIDVYAAMGFTCTKLNRRLYRFERHPLYVNHALLRYSTGLPHHWPRTSASSSVSRVRKK